ncbi:MAG TPA: helix-turn-helix domain-containing protein [Gemmatimonadales bacterium]|nr:helix-turn-helix domain-containing protein [Gemmatimonadales bacterium]
MNSEILVSALDAVSDAVLVCDRGGAVLHANRGARELFGPSVPQSRAELARHPIAALAREQQLAGAAVVVIPRAKQTLSLAERERLAIEQALAESGWQLAVAARRLGISRTTLWRRLKQYGMSRPSQLAAVGAE